MKLKSGGHEELSFYHMQKHDRAKEMVLGEFNRKLMDAPCHLRQTKQSSP